MLDPFHTSQGVAVDTLSVAGVPYAWIAVAQGSLTSLIAWLMIASNSRRRSSQVYCLLTAWQICAHIIHSQKGHRRGSTAYSCFLARIASWSALQAAGAQPSNRKAAAEQQPCTVDYGRPHCLQGLGYPLYRKHILSVGPERVRDSSICLSAVGPGCSRRRTVEATPAG